MLEVRIHGRGGQGAVLASLVLARAAFRKDAFVQSFPEFGVERRGAPVSAFLRVSEAPIFIRSKIYAPDCVVVLDQTLLEIPSVLDGLKPEGILILNYSQNESLPPYASIWRTFRVDASALASSLELGNATVPIVNTVMVGAFAKATDLVSLNNLSEAIAETFPENSQKNIAAAQLGFEKCQKT